MTIEENLEKIRLLQLERDDATRELREKVMELERQSDAISEPYDEKIECLRNEIEEIVIKNGESFENSEVFIEYREGRLVEPMAFLHFKS